MKAAGRSQEGASLGLWCFVVDQATEARCFLGGFLVLYDTADSINFPRHFQQRVGNGG